MVRFSDPGDVQRSMQRLGEENVREAGMEMTGRILGALPQHRTFEFEPEGENRVITGRVGPSIPDAGTLNDLRHQRVKIRLMETRVGSGRPRYVLTEPPEKAQ